MNERIKELADEAKQHCFEQSQKRVDPKNYMSYSDMYDKKFAELLIDEICKLNKQQSHELQGVIIDTEEGDGFDQVCLNTVKRVHDYLAADTLKKHFEIKHD